MSDAPQARQPSLAAIPRSPLGHKVMFFLLTTMAFCIFAPAVILPVLREYGELALEEERLTAKVAQLESESEHRAELAEAFAHDTLINERLAVLDLHYQKPNEEVVAVLPPEYAPEEAAITGMAPSTTLVLPKSFPPWAHTAQRWANDNGVLDLFFDQTRRSVLLLMSCGLLVAAFVLYAPKRQTRLHSPRAIGGATSTRELPCSA
jgi:hypothetical protein